MDNLVPFLPRDDYAIGELNISFDELIQALQLQGSDVTRFLLTTNNEALPVAND